MKASDGSQIAKCFVAGFIIFAVGSAAHASTTKVGNGDDGADLEVLTEVKAGPVWTSRLRAIELLRNLNVTGISGLGLLIPELKNTQMLVSEQNVHPTVEQPGTAEISDDKGAVYARTFAEPYAATRFFPAALKLTNDQLVALHIHEALHRSLPPEIRSDENKVMHLTLALTSPGASFDRVLQRSTQIRLANAWLDLTYSKRRVWKKPRRLPKARRLCR